MCLEFKLHLDRMSLFGGNDVHVQEDESEFDDEFDQQRIDEAVANQLPDLSSDDEGRLMICS